MSEDAVCFLKVIILGNAGCGKTSMMTRWISNTFSLDNKSTIGCNQQRKQVMLEGTGPVDLFVWDTSGQEIYESLAPLYTRSAAVAIITTAINDGFSFESIPKWTNALDTSNGGPPPILLAVNKMDLEEKAVMTGSEISDKYNADFQGIFLVSAQSGHGIDELFCAAAIEAVKFIQAAHPLDESVVLPEMPRTPKIAKNGCC
jgi:small GTP-binding protein